MASRIVVNNFDRYKKALHAEQDRRVKLAAIMVMRHARSLLNVSGTGVRGPTGGIVRAVKRTRKTIYGAFPSRPGEAPHKQTGALRMAVAWEMARRGVARVGIPRSVWYGWYLEVHKNRPWLARSLREKSREVVAILGAPWKWSE